MPLMIRSTLPVGIKSMSSNSPLGTVLVLIDLTDSFVLFQLV